jgi:hypothetical protein
MTVRERGIPTSVAVFGAILVLVAGYVAPEVVLTGEPDHGAALVFWIVGPAGLLLLGISLMIPVLSATTRITSTEVACYASALSRAPVWTEPLGNYRGVALIQEQRKRRSSTPSIGGPNRYTHILQWVILDHEDPEKCVELFSSENQRKARGAQQRFASSLGLSSVDPGQ